MELFVFILGNRYAHYDNNPTFSDFSPFGGWATPYAKQYAGTSTFCSFSVDFDIAFP